MPRTYRRSYKKLMSQIKKLQSQADRLRDKERSVAIGQALAIIERHEITAAELGFKSNGTTKSTAKTPAKSKIPPKYRGPGGITWSGRGKTPVWLREALAKGRKRDDFLIKR